MAFRPFRSLRKRFKKLKKSTTDFLASGIDDVLDVAGVSEEYREPLARYGSEALLSVGTGGLSMAADVATGLGRNVERKYTGDLSPGERDARLREETARREAEREAANMRTRRRRGPGRMGTASLLGGGSLYAGGGGGLLG